ncbi:MAG: ABC transporter substrate-binding protein [Planctomycetota bacterium]|jgi:NitT/TauT family transport system substrate-binding protein|nr:ABC transporter substrate-binding protein [Planctomycetota bacterium]
MFVKTRWPRRSLALLFFLSLGFATLSGFSLPGAETTVRVGYVSTPSVNGQLLVAQEKGYFQEEGLRLEGRDFTSDIPLMRAFAGGNLDVAIMGAMLASLPAQGFGRVFLVNSREIDNCLLLARPETGAEKLEDLQGTMVVSVRGTSAHLFLHHALKAHGLDSERDIDLVSLDMAAAVEAFLAGSVSYIATWYPHDLRIREKVPGVRTLARAGDYPQAGVLTAWVASDAYYASNPDTLKGIIRAWIRANQDLLVSPQENRDLVGRIGYPDLPELAAGEGWSRIKLHSTREWLDFYADGSVDAWLDQTREFLAYGAGWPQDTELIMDRQLFWETGKAALAKVEGQGEHDQE